MKVDQEIKNLLQKHHNAVQKINNLQQEIQNLEVAKQSLKIELETKLWNVNKLEDGYSDVFDATFAINGTGFVSILSFCEDCISRVNGIIHHPISKNLED